MVDPLPMPVPANPDSTPESLRAAEVEKVARRGQEHAEKEQALQMQLKQKRIEEGKRAKKSAEKAQILRQEINAHAKDFRLAKVRREKEIAADKARIEKQAAIEEEKRKQQRETLQKKDKYFQDLREAARLKILHEHNANAMKREYEIATKNAAMEHTAAIDAAMQAERDAFSDIERDKRARKAIVDEQTHAALYRLQGEERMRLRELETEMSRECSHLDDETDSHVRERKRSAITLAINAKRRLLENDIASKRQAIVAEDHRKHESLETESLGKRDEARRNFLHASQKADRVLGNRLNDIALKYSEHHVDPGRSTV